MHLPDQIHPFQAGSASPHKPHPALFWQSSDVRRLFPATRSHLHPRMQFHSSHKYRISREYFQVSARLLLRCGYTEARYIQCPLPQFHLQFLPGRLTSADM